MSSKHPYALCLLAALVIGFCGCSDSPVVPVTGTISFADRELPEVCRLTFVPTETDKEVSIRPSGGTMDDDGVYHLPPYKGVEGLMPGTYKIRLSYFDLKKNGNPDVDGDWKEQQFEAGELTIEEGSGAVVHDIAVE